MIQIAELPAAIKAIKACGSVGGGLAWSLPMPLDSLDMGTLNAQHSCPSRQVGKVVKL